MDNLPPIPDDTILDKAPLVPALPAKALTVMKLIYLASDVAQNMLHGGATPTEVVDAFETLRRKGYITIYVNADLQGGGQIVLTDSGIKTAQILSLMRQPSAGEA